MARPLIFDFDGVIVDSETISNRALAQCLTSYGFATTPEESVARYTGMRMTDCIIAVERIHGRKVPDDFTAAYRAHSFERLRKELKPVKGAVEFIRSLGDRPIAIASSSGPPRLALCLDLVGLTDRFTGKVFSAADMARGKPFPDVFLHAAKNLGVDAKTCIVIEDGTHGVEGAVAAGMTAIGLTAGSHCEPGHAERLRAAGASFLAADYDEIAERIAELDAG